MSKLEFLKVRTFSNGEFLKNVKKNPGFFQKAGFFERPGFLKNLKTEVLTIKCIHLLGLFMIIDLYHCYIITVD